MSHASKIDTADVTALYDGSRGDLFQLVFGEQIHVGGFNASVALADLAGIREGQKGVDLCCCNGAGMRFLVRFRGVASMTGVDISEKVIALGRSRCGAEGSADQIRFVLADACASGLASESADFVWSEDAWVYVPDKPALVAEAARIVKRGGTIAFTDWVVGPAGLSEAEAEPLLSALTFPNMESVEGYRSLLEKNGCDVQIAESTGIWSRFMDLYAEMLDTQLRYDALRLCGFQQSRLDGEVAGFRGLAELGRADKLTQGRFVAGKR